jgi:cytidyltransferase-like protein
MKFKYNKIVIGGTFDLLHNGHIHFIVQAFEKGALVDIGLTSDNFNTTRGKTSIENQATRKKNLENFLEQSGFSNRYKIIVINDIYGTSVTDPSLEAILATDDTLQNVKQVNEKRLENGLVVLDVIKISYVRDETNSILSSTRIKSGEVATDGKRYYDLLLSIVDKTFDEQVRNHLKLPFGKLIDVKSLSIHSKNVITVGDVTTHNILKQGIKPKLSIIDFKVQRKPTYTHLRELGFEKAQPDSTVINNPGGISKSLITEVNSALQKNTNSIVLVEGEEDLAVIPAVLLSPLGTRVLYGQPNEGMVEVVVDEKIKNQIRAILRI